MLDEWLFEEFSFTIDVMRRIEFWMKDSQERKKMESDEEFISEIELLLKIGKERIGKRIELNDFEDRKEEEDVKLKLHKFFEFINSSEMSMEQKEELEKIQRRKRDIQKEEKVMWKKGLSWILLIRQLIKYLRKYEPELEEETYTFCFTDFLNNIRFYYNGEEKKFFKQYVDVNDKDLEIEVFLPSGFYDYDNSRDLKDDRNLMIEYKKEKKCGDEVEQIIEKRHGKIYYGTDFSNLMYYGFDRLVSFEQKSKRDDVEKDSLLVYGEMVYYKELGEEKEKANVRVRKLINKVAVYNKMWNKMNRIGVSKSIKRRLFLESDFKREKLFIDLNREIRGENFLDGYRFSRLIGFVFSFNSRFREKINLRILILLLQKLESFDGEILRKELEYFWNLGKLECVSCLWGYVLKDGVDFPFSKSEEMILNSKFGEILEGEKFRLVNHGGEYERNTLYMGMTEVQMLGKHAGVWSSLNKNTSIRLRVKWSEIYFEGAMRDMLKLAQIYDKYRKEVKKKFYEGRLIEGLELDERSVQGIGKLAKNSFSKSFILKFIVCWKLKVFCGRIKGKDISREIEEYFMELLMEI